MTHETLQAIERYSGRYESFFNEIRADLDELRATGVISRARELSARTGQRFNDNQEPLFFTGDLEASFVLVHLNPKQPNESAPTPFPIRSFEEYFDACRSFGARMYGRSSPRTHRSPFDHKQIRFLRPFGVIDFVEGDKPEDRFANLERVIDRKLQLELIPYEVRFILSERLYRGRPAAAPRANHAGDRGPTTGLRDLLRQGLRAPPG